MSPIASPHNSCNENTHHASDNRNWIVDSIFRTRTILGIHSARGAGFAYNSAGGGVAVAGGGPTVYYPSGYGYRGPVYIPQGCPGVYGGYGPVPSPGYVRRGPISNFTSYWVTYPNVW